MSKGIMTNGITTSEETYYFTKGYQQGATDMEKAKQIIIDSLIKQLEQIRAEAIDEFVNEIKRIYFDDAKVIRCCELVANEMKENK